MLLPKCTYCYLRLIIVQKNCRCQKQRYIMSCYDSIIQQRVLHFSYSHEITLYEKTFKRDALQKKKKRGLIKTKSAVIKSVDLITLWEESRTKCVCRIVWRSYVRSESRRSRKVPVLAKIPCVVLLQVENGKYSLVNLSQLRLPHRKRLNFKVRICLLSLSQRDNLPLTER